MHSSLTRQTLGPRETRLSITLLILVLVAFAAPAVPGWEMGAIHFVDQRHFHGLPNALDVLSNVPFAFFGLIGLWRLRHSDCSGGVRLSAGLFFWGLIATAIGSSFYHLHPDAMRLAADRAGMAVAFAGMVGLAVGNRVSFRAAWPAAVFALFSGLMAVGVYHVSGNVLPWGVVQFGGMVLVLALAASSPVGGQPKLKLAVVIAFYALAKIFELGDEVIFQGLQEVVSGHSLKHGIAALAALPVLWFLQAKALA